LLGQVERYLKQAIVDKDPATASSALVSGIHLMKSSPDIVRIIYPQIFIYAGETMGFRSFGNFEQQAHNGPVSRFRIAPRDKEER
jgi:hypothetical protein